MINDILDQLERATIILLIDLIIKFWKILLKKLVKKNGLHLKGGLFLVQHYANGSL